MQAGTQYYMYCKIKNKCKYFFLHNFSNNLNALLSQIIAIQKVKKKKKFL